MRRAGVVTLQILGAAVLVAAVCGLIGLIVSHFVGSGGALNGFSLGDGGRRRPRRLVGRQLR